ncbi:MAG TPA: putative metal-binding motif-containing protein, partial [Myxococcota bacterium]|nr:putative metal-binding motif-containing protein [Myxococcota bacterium]
DDDLDADGALFATDCDDQNAALSPLNAEIPYDSLDNDCSPASPDDDLDADGALFATDCDDQNAALSPLNTEIPYDSLDNDCSPTSPDDDLDADGALAATDCDDSDATSYPGAPESCEDGVDQDCDGADSSCTVSTANFQDAPCTGYYPYDQPGAGWSWEGSQSGGSYRWTVTTSGRSTFDGLDVWGLTINGSASWSGGTYQELFTTYRWVTCETDGLHIVADEWSRTTVAHVSSGSSGVRRYLDRPLLMPAAPARFDTWDLDGLAVPTPDGQGQTGETLGSTFYIPYGRQYSFLGSNVPVWVTEYTDNSGTTDYWFVSPTYGILYWYNGSAAFRVTAVSGL